MSYAIAAINAANATYGDPSANGFAASVDSFENDGNTYVEVRNTDVAPHTVTFTGTQPCRLGSIHPVAVVVAAGARRVIGPFPLARFGRQVGLTFDSVGSFVLYLFRGA